MSLNTPDPSWDHLYPDFRNRLHGIFAECAAQGLNLRLVEGYRSQERQAWLFGQGRPGDPNFHKGPIVTANRTSKWHGAGLAADCYPVHSNGVVLDFTHKELQIFRGAMPRFGLKKTEFQGDFGHVQMDADEATRQKALAWVLAGFQQPEEDEPPVSILLRGAVIEGAAAFLDSQNHVWGKAHFLCEALDAKILVVTQHTIAIERMAQIVEFPAQFLAGRGFVPVGQLSQLPQIQVHWENATRHVLITTD